MITTQDASIARRLQLLRSHGMTRDTAEMERVSEGGWYYEQQVLGFNYRITDIQAALGLSQLARMEPMHEQREALANRYDELLARLPVRLPPRQSDRRSSWHLYAIEVDGAGTSRSRAQVFQYLRDAGIGVNVHYIPIHTQPFYARLGFKRGDFPASEHYYSRAISLPLHPTLSAPEQDFVVNTLADALA